MLKDEALAASLSIIVNQLKSSESITFISVYGPVRK